MNAVAKVSYTHDAMIDLIIANPAIKQVELARHFSYTQAWVSRVMSSDAFKERLAARKSELVDKGIIHSVEQGFEALTRQSMELLAQKLDATANPELALKVLQTTTQALGYGAKAGGPAIQQNFTIVSPEKARDGTTWLESHKPLIPGGGPQVLDAEIVTNKKLVKL